MFISKVEQDMENAILKISLYFHFQNANEEIEKMMSLISIKK